MSTLTTTAAPKPAVETSRRLSIDIRQYGILAALVIIMGLFEVLTGGRLLMPGNVNNLIQQNSYVLILAIGMVMVIIGGHIDLSVGSVVAMVGAVTALGMNNWGLPWWAAVLLALLTGCLVGAWQGFWVAYMGIPAFIVTLAGMLLFRGLTLVLLHGGTIGGLPAVVRDDWSRVVAPGARRSQQARCLDLGPRRAGFRRRGGATDPFSHQPAQAGLPD